MKLFIVNAADSTRPLIACLSSSRDQQPNIMTSLGGSITVLIVIIGVTSFQGLDFPELVSYVEDTDLGYRPWDRNDTATTWISLSGMRIGALSSTFRLNIPNLRWLVMDDNAIQNVPSRAFRSFPDLTYISLVRNQISDFETGAFGWLENLEVLDMDWNPIQDRLGSSILGPLIKLKRLYLRNCQIQSFTLPMNMDHLSHLYLSGNELDMFYTSNESPLLYLHLDANRLRFVSMSKFESLIYANFSNNQFTRIVRRSEVPPAYYARTVRERGYYYRYTDYGEVDESGLYLDDASAVLEDLIVSFNRISEIEWDTFQNTKALTNVDLRNNEISEVYAGTFDNLLKLKNILLDSNKIKQINHRAFVNLPNLQTISLKNNQIDDLDEDAFTKLNSSANEVYLFLDNNRIHTLRRGAFRGMKGLKHIGLSNNRIKTISSQAFVNLPNLESIVIEYQSRDESVDPSPLELATIRAAIGRRGSIESDAFFDLSNLTTVIIRGNSFAKIEPQAFHDLPKLTTLDLSNNSISTLSAKAFCDLPAVENLYLGGNSISAIAPETFPKQLKYLNLASNLVCPEFSCWHVGELHQLQQLDVSGIIEQFTIDDLAGLSKNLTVIVGQAGSMSSLPRPCY